MINPLNNTTVITLDIDQLLFVVRNYIDSVNNEIFKNIIIPYNFGIYFELLEKLLIQNSVCRILGNKIGLNIEKEIPVIELIPMEIKSYYLNYLNKMESYVKFLTESIVYNKLIDLNLNDLFLENKLTLDIKIDNHELHILLTRVKNDV